MLNYKILKLTLGYVIGEVRMNIFSADIKIYRGFTKMTEENGATIAKLTKEQPVSTVKNLQGLLLPKAEILKKLS